MSHTEQKGRAIALLPIGVFLIIFLGSGIIMGDFYAMPAIVAFLIALAVAFLQNRKLNFNEKITVIAKGVSDENIEKLRENIEPYCEEEADLTGIRSFNSSKTSCALFFLMLSAAKYFNSPSLKSS